MQYIFSISKMKTAKNNVLLFIMFSFSVAPVYFPSLGGGESNLALEFAEDMMALKMLSILPKSKLDSCILRK